MRNKVLLVVLVLLWTPVVHADAYDLFGAGSRSAAMSGAQAASVNDYTAIFYNVARLSGQPSHVSFGLMGSVDDVAIRLKRRPNGYDLPDRGGSAAAIPSDYRLRPRANTEDITNTYGIHLGGVTGPGSSKLRLGFAAFLPADRFGLQNSRYADEREQYFSNQLDFELLGDRSQRQILMAGASWAFSPRFSVGLGLSFIPEVATTNTILVNNPTDQSEIELTLSNDLGGRVAPVVGVSFEPTEKIHVGAVYRGELYYLLEGVNSIQIRGYQEAEDFPVEQNFEVALQYTPHQFVFGTSYEEGRYLLAIDATYSLWSGYLNHQNQSVQGFQDTVSFRAGLEFRYSPETRLRMGGGFIPSPVPEQSGRTNYVDNDRLMASVGTGHTVELFGERVELGWYAQLQYLRPEDTDKTRSTVFEPCSEGATLVCDELPDDVPDPASGEIPSEHQGLQTGNPGFPGFQSFGTLFSMGVDAKWLF